MNYNKICIYFLLEKHARICKCKTFLLKMSFIWKRTKNHFHIKSSPLSLALKQRLGAAGKWPHYLRCLLWAMASRAIIPLWLFMTCKISIIIYSTYYKLWHDRVLFPDWIQTEEVYPKTNDKVENIQWQLRHRTPLLPVNTTNNQ